MLNYFQKSRGLAHLFDEMRCAMLNFVPRGSSAAVVAAPLQRIHVSPVTQNRGGVAGVLQFEQDNS